ncbi:MULTISPECIES: lasso peptide biosynthesis PqqD family chaperone [Streptomyces]|uniref:Lasso peptide biosynthesis PqqD family chaperone n=1 Tax=Streptomyces lycii TaxID=2654337 RepID=A0ABQ7FJL3_9ACTN|nr:MULTISPECIES: lasso peptide biosynthesis PqqD family chaperone [Streptomyces]KAF4408865.1 lasso peptide biosynthesis PqqD family chaperone [Streptomyces lycii]PGH52007.1 HPr-rel-A system PqqD family protein [Streptomyces sp. Ru87]
MNPRLRDGVTTVETEYGAVLLDQRHGKYWQLNPAGTVLLGAFEDGSGIDGAVETLAERYGVEPATARDHLGALLEQLRTAGLVTS